MQRNPNVLFYINELILESPRTVRFFQRNGLCSCPSVPLSHVKSLSNLSKPTSLTHTLQNSLYWAFLDQDFTK